MVSNYSFICIKKYILCGIRGQKKMKIFLRAYIREYVLKEKDYTPLILHVDIIFSVMCSAKYVLPSIS